MRLLYQLHRWPGVILAAFMFVWFASGVIIMYAPSTTPTVEAQWRHAPLLDPQAGWLSAGDAWARSAAQRQADHPATSAEGNRGGNARKRGALADVLASARLVRRAGTPYWLFEDGSGARYAVSAIDASLHRFDAAQAQEVAAQWLDEPASAVSVLEAFDTGAYVRNYESLAPFYRLGVADSSTEVIVSARTGDVIRVTDRVDRVLFWTGNWVHLFRYLDAIGLEGDARRHILTWTALATVIVTLVGLIIAWIRWRPRWGHKPQYSQGRVQPYRTWSGRWHFWSGLIGGVIALTWISSGFLTNLPWQVFTAANLNRDEAARYLGNAQPESLRTWQPHAFGPEGALTVELAWSRVGDEAVLHAIDSDGNRRVLDGGAPLSTDAVLAAVGRVAGKAPSAQVLQTDYDAYYYRRHQQTANDRPLPVLRVDLGDAAGTRVYVDPQTGRVLSRQDTSRRFYRWAFSALHHWDFGWLYARPLWDGWMLLWLGFGLTLSATSLVLAYKRIARTARSRNVQTDTAIGAEIVAAASAPGLASVPEAPLAEPTLAKPGIAAATGAAAGPVVGPAVNPAANPAVG